MIKFQYINENIKQIKEQVKTGLISTTILSHYAIYSRYDYYRRNKHSKRDAVFFIVDDFELSERTIYRIIKNMNEEI